MSKPAPAQQPTESKAPASVPAAAPRNDLRSLLSSDAMKKQLAMALPKVLPVDRFLRVLFTALNRDPKLGQCDRDSVLAGVMNAAQLGLEIDPTLGRAYLIPFNDRRKGMVAQFVIGYKGYIDLFWRSGQGASITAEAVYEKDHFVYKLGLNQQLDHIPSDDPDRGRLVYAYAVAELSNGGKVLKVLNRTQVMNAKAYSRGSDSEYSPWQTNEPEMWAKTAIRALADRIPLSAELREAIRVESAQEQAAFASAIEVPATAVAESSQAEVGSSAAGPAQTAGEAPAGLTPRQRVNSLLLEAGSAGLADQAQAIIAKHGGDVSRMYEQQLVEVGNALAGLVRASMEGGGK